MTDGVECSLGDVARVISHSIAVQWYHSSRYRCMIAVAAQWTQEMGRPRIVRNAPYNASWCRTGRRGVVQSVGAGASGAYDASYGVVQCCRTVSPTLADRFFWEQGVRPPSQILALRVCNMTAVSKSQAASIYLWCTVSTDFFRVNVYVHSVHKLCTVSTKYTQCLHVCTVFTDYTQVIAYVHSVHKLRTVSTKYTQCLQTILG